MSYVLRFVKINCAMRLGQVALVGLLCNAAQRNMTGFLTVLTVLTVVSRVVGKSADENDSRIGTPTSQLRIL